MGPKGHGQEPRVRLSLPRPASSVTEPPRLTMAGGGTAPRADQAALTGICAGSGSMSAAVAPSPGGSSAADAERS